MVDSNLSGPSAIAVAPWVRKALSSGSPVVALESALITHGLPYPRNVEVALQLEQIVTDEGVTPATAAVIEGRVRVGLTSQQIQALGQSKSNYKFGVRDLAAAAVKNTGGGTTVAATILAASMVGIRVFATGGIGGVHRENPFDISGDLTALAETRMIVVCAGAKAILDLPSTLERLETLSVPVIGYRTREFPAFYSRTSGLEVSVRLDSPSEIGEYWMRHCDLGMKTALLIANPIPEASALAPAEIDAWTDQASREAMDAGIHGQALTPFLLRRLAELSDGRSITANVALLTNNVRLAASIAVALENPRQSKESGK